MSYPCITPRTIFRRLHTSDGRVVDLTLYHKAADAPMNTVAVQKIAHLNEAAEQVVKLCNGVCSIPDIARTLSGVYSGTAESVIAQRVEQIITPLVKDGFIAHLDKPLAADQARLLPDPVSIKHVLNNMSVELTYACNLKCVHCNVDGRDGDPQALPFNMVKRLTDQFAAAGGQNVTISGGEAMLRKDIFEIISYMSAKPLYIDMASNGILITKEAALKLKDAGLRGIQLSLDGHCAAIHDKYRGLPGAFDQTVAAIANARETGLAVAIACVLNRSNIGNITEMFELCGKFGILPSFTMQKPVGRALTQGRCYQISYMEYAQSRMQINEHLLERTGSDPFEVYPKDKQRFRCAAGVHTIAVRPNGDVVPCSEFYLPEEVLGNITCDNLVGIWNSDHPLLEILRQKDAGSTKLCSGCKHNDYCNGGCPASAQKTWGDYHWPDLETCSYIALADQRLKVVCSNTSTVTANTTCD
jgi:radical SAM protein with 4Fe4S-binding SPASM domain